MPDSDLAKVYGVETRVINQAVKRNIERLPADFMFQLTFQALNLITEPSSIVRAFSSYSHCGRRTFTSLCLRKGMSPEDIRALTGHTTAGMMMKYVKFDDESKRGKMNLLNSGQSHGVETVFEHSITEPERIRLDIPTREAYLEIFEGKTASVNAHLAVY